MDEHWPRPTDHPLMARERPAEAGTMRAVFRHRYGPPDVLGIATLPCPQPRPGEALVRVAAVALHPGDHFVLTGEPSVLRLVFGLRRPRHAIPGTDLAGEVVAVGRDVATLRPGDRVFGWNTAGALAQFARVPAEQLVPVPDGLSTVAAAAVPTSGMTALQALRDIGRVEAGQSVLVIGASGGVGSFAVQIAAALGAEVTGVCSAPNLELVRSLGADEVVDHTAAGGSLPGGQYDVILDNAEARPLPEIRRLLAPTGTLIPNCGRGGRRLGPLPRIVRARVQSAFGRQRLRPFTSVGRRRDLITLADLLAAGRIRPVVDRTYPFEATADAFRQIGTGHTRGKVVITV